MSFLFGIVIGLEKIHLVIVCSCYQQRAFNVYLAKATTILLYVLGLVALQLLLLPVESQVLQWMVPSEFRTDLSINEITNFHDLRILFPKHFY